MSEELDGRTMIKESRYVLEKRFNYARGGQEVEAEFIVLHAPSSRHAKPCGRIKQAFTRASIEHAERARAAGGVVEVGEAEEPSGAEMMMGIAASPVVEYDEVLETGRLLFEQPGVAFVEGEVPMKRSHIDRMTFADFEGMLGQYVRDFILRSSSLETRTTSSKESRT